MEQENSLIKKAYQIFRERQQRRMEEREPHKRKVKVARRAKNKVARKSRVLNRKRNK